MMREVVDHEHVSDRGALLLTTLHSFEGAEALTDLLRREPERSRRGIDTHGILDIVMPAHREQQLAGRGIVWLLDLEARSLGSEAHRARRVVARSVGHVRDDARHRMALRELHGAR